MPASCPGPLPGASGQPAGTALPSPTVARRACHVNPLACFKANFPFPRRPRWHAGVLRPCPSVCISQEVRMSQSETTPSPEIVETQPESAAPERKRRKARPRQRQAKPDAPTAAQPEPPPPLPLSAEHLRMLKEESAISDEVIVARGYRSVNDPKELKALGFRGQQLRVPGLLLPLHGTDGSQPLSVYRPDLPYIDAKKKVRKYEFP